LERICAVHESSERAAVIGEASYVTGRELIAKTVTAADLLVDLDVQQVSRSRGCSLPTRTRGTSFDGAPSSAATFEDGLLSLALIDAAHRSSEGGGWEPDGLFSELLPQ
jgi:hypothetical protein